MRRYKNDSNGNLKSGSYNNPNISLIRKVSIITKLIEETMCEFEFRLIKTLQSYQGKEI